MRPVFRVAAPEIFIFAILVEYPLAVLVVDEFQPVCLVDVAVYYLGAVGYLVEQVYDRVLASGKYVYLYVSKLFHNLLK